MGGESGTRGSALAVSLRYISDLSLEEIAAVRHLRPGTVKSRLGYGLRSLRRLLRPESIT